MEGAVCVTCVEVSEEEREGDGQKQKRARHGNEVSTESGDEARFFAKHHANVVPVETDRTISDMSGSLATIRARAKGARD